MLILKNEGEVASILQKCNSFYNGTIVQIFTISEKQNAIRQLILTFIISDVVRFSEDLLVQKFLDFLCSGATCNY